MHLYNRQKLILHLLAASDGRLGATDFQKLLFLYTRKWEDVPSYDFVPHRFGCFSFQAAADQETLCRKDCLEADDRGGYRVTEKGQSVLDTAQVKRLAIFTSKTVPERKDALIARIYREYPYYASRSGIVERVLPDPADRQAIEQASVREEDPALFTIGYEGDNIDGYLNRLIGNNVRILCDVRKNPLSRKTGFSKKSLAGYCQKVGVEYRHMPELGIPGHRRRELKCQADYDALFEEYEREDLPHAGDAVMELGELQREHGRIALTCFEKEHISCHRHCVAEEMEKKVPGCPQALHI